MTISQQQLMVCETVSFSKKGVVFGPQLCIALVRVPPKTGPDFAPPFFLKPWWAIFRVEIWARTCARNPLSAFACRQQLLCFVLAAKQCDPNLLCHLGGNQRISVLDLTLGQLPVLSPPADPLVTCPSTFAGGDGLVGIGLSHFLAQTMPLPK